VLELQEFAAHLVAPDHAAAVIAPAYDALTPAGRRDLSSRQPDSFLNCLPEGPADEATLAGNRAAAHRLVATGRFGPLLDGLLAVLELTDVDRTVTAVIGDLDVAAYLDGRIRPHEHVRPDRVAELTRYLCEVRVASSPVAVVHRPDAALAATVTQVRRRFPELDAALPGGARLRLWTVADEGLRAALTVGVRNLEGCTVADGHHRVAAVARRVGPDATAAPPDDRAAGRVLSALLPADQVAVDPFHRRIDDLGQVREADLLAVLATTGLEAVPLPGPALPPHQGTVHVTVRGRWWSVRVADRPQPGPAGHLDAAIADAELLRPLATLAPGPHPAAIVPVAGPLGIAALDRPGSIGVALAPVTVEQVLEVTGAGAVLPHKSTYLRPKLRSGVLLAPR
jgi:uncharacterized protein (DUF1015 family)